MLNKMLKIFWPTLCIAIAVFFIAYIRMRDKIPFYKREKFEKWLMLSLIILLLINIALIVNERRVMANEMNDCIRFYRYFPYFYNDSEFYFVNEWCYEYFDEDEIKRLRESGEQYLNPVKPVTRWDSVELDEENLKEMFIINQSGG